MQNVALGARRGTEAVEQDLLVVNPVSERHSWSGIEWSMLVW